MAIVKVGSTGGVPSHPTHHDLLVLPLFAWRTHRASQAQKDTFSANQCMFMNKYK
jgi:hypothetical protein